MTTTLTDRPEPKQNEKGEMDVDMQKSTPKNNPEKIIQSPNANSTNEDVPMAEWNKTKLHNNNSNSTGISTLQDGSIHSQRQMESLYTSPSVFAKYS